MASQSREKQADPNAGAKTQARRRLIGAGVVCAATAGLLFSVLEREPKPASPDVVLKGSQQSAPLSPPISPPVASASDTPKVEAKPEPKTEPKTEPKPEAKTESAAEPTAVARPPLVVAPLPKADVAPQDPIAKLAEEKAKATPPKPEAKPDVKKDEPKKAEPKKDEPKKVDAKKEESKGYSVQIGAFSSKDAAQNALAKIKGLKLIGYTETVSTPAGERTRVRAGPYKDKEGAQSALNKLKAAGIDAALVAP